MSLKVERRGRNLPSSGESVPADHLFRVLSIRRFEIGAERVGDREEPDLREVGRDVEQLRELRQRWPVVQALPSPLARSASMKLQTDWMIEPQLLAWKNTFACSIRPAKTGTSTAGSRWKFSRR